MVRYGSITRDILRIEKIKADYAHMNTLRDSLALIQGEIQKIRRYEQKIAELTGNYAPERKKEKSLTGARAIRSSGLAGGLFTDEDINEFVKNIKLKRNRDFLKIKNPKDKQIQILKALPNVLPIDGWISRGFDKKGEFSDRPHHGLDIAAPMNKPIKVTAPGIVTFAGWQRDLGNLVIIDHGYGFLTRYGHCSRVLVNKGDFVKRNATIALVGNSGRSSAPHLHYEVIHNGDTVDPLIFIVK
jgi:murein DD-endopeptidase MepM/ murein hydrolase activator NlpD